MLMYVTKLSEAALKYLPMFYTTLVDDTLTIIHMISIQIRISGETMCMFLSVIIKMIHLISSSQD